jgi:N-acylneuraminate cytidylyltransferase
MIDRIVVSTDDYEIAEVSRAYGAEVIIRPDDISGDLAPSELALLHVLDSLESNGAYRPQLIVFLQCTSPLTRPDDIDGTIRTLLSHNADSALAVTPFHHFLWSQDLRGNTVGVNHDPRTRQMRQERDPYFLETGAVYVMRTAGFKSAKHRFFGRIAMHEIPRERALEIDDEFDFFLASQILRAR